MLDDLLPPKDHNNPPDDSAYWDSHAAKLQNIAKRLSDPKALKKAAGKLREDWFDFGLLLAEAKDNMESNKKFNSWLKSNGLDDSTTRDDRANAIWLTYISDGMLELIPETLHSPKSIRDWYRKTLKEAIAESEGDLDAATGSPTYGAFVDAINADDWDVFVAKYKEGLDKLPFDQMPAVDAAQKLLDKLAKHMKPGEVFAELTRMVNAGALDDLDAPEPDSDWPDETQEEMFPE